MNKFLCMTAIMLVVTGCSHNTAVLTVGEHAKLGIDPQNMSMSASYMDGLALTDVSRENSEWEIQVDSEAGMTYDKATGTVKGVKKIRRVLGPQITGYLRDLAEADPEAARTYLEATKYYWKARAEEATVDTKDPTAAGK